LVAVLGFDIGGANTKAAYINSELAEAYGVSSEYFPFWKEPNKLPTILFNLKNKLHADSVDALAVTMTAELSDAYQTKREGVNHILSCVQKAFPNCLIFVVNTDSELFTINEAKAEPLRAAAANWAATGWLVAQKLSSAIVVDVGSTSTSIIPIVCGKVAARGKTDLDKLICGELVYTGSLRTNVAAIVKSVPLRGGLVPVSSELFALSADVHLVLGHISSANYTSETADSRGRTVPEALARLSRVVCADTDMLTKAEILELAKYVYIQQVKQINSAIQKVYSYTKVKITDALPIVVTGLGKEFLAKKASEKIVSSQIVDLDFLLSPEAVFATPAVGTAAMLSHKLTGELPKWL
jgi:probable H4MPT-linked C1 transfer pathway protein